VRQYTVRDTETSLDTVLLRAEYSPHSAALPTHQRARGEEGSSRMLHELLSSKEELAALDAYPLSIPSLNLFTFGNSAVIIGISITLLVVFIVFYIQYRKWSTSS